MDGYQSILSLMREVWMDNNGSLYWFLSCRLADALFHAMLLWYYSTLTLQEHILIANGSRYESGHFDHVACSVMFSQCENFLGKHRNPKKLNDSITLATKIGHNSLEHYHYRVKSVLCCQHKFKHFTIINASIILVAMFPYHHQVLYMYVTLITGQFLSVFVSNISRKIKECFIIFCV